MKSTFGEINEIFFIDHMKQKVTENGSMLGQ